MPRARSSLLVLLAQDLVPLTEKASGHYSSGFQCSDKRYRGLVMFFLRVGEAACQGLLLLLRSSVIAWRDDVRKLMVGLGQSCNSVGEARNTGR